jgi:hypothetical protein
MKSFSHHDLFLPKTNLFSFPETNIFIFLKQIKAPRPKAAGRGGVPGLGGGNTRSHDHEIV